MGMQHAVLVLNANFEPLNVCNIKRAVGLLLMGKASLVLNGRGGFVLSHVKWKSPLFIVWRQIRRRVQRQLCKRDLRAAVITPAILRQTIPSYDS
jgi:hypothetical protein